MTNRRVTFALLILVTHCQGDDTSGSRSDLAVIVSPKDVSYSDESIKDLKDQSTTDPIHVDWPQPDFAWPEVEPFEDVGDEMPQLQDAFDTALPDVTPDICVPSCSGKECGPDGCGGVCGSCPKGYECLDYKCKCIPSCAGKECGDNGCGGSCGTCPDGCTPPTPPGVTGVTEYKCMIWGDCKQAGQISCTDYTKQDNSGSPTNSDKVDLYECRPGQAVNGPEKAYRFVPDGDGEIVIELSTSQTFLDIYLLEGSCNGHNCVAWNHNKIVHTVKAGNTYWIVVDGSINNNGNYTLSIGCSWYPSM